MQKTHGKPLGVVGFPAAKESVERVVCRDREASGVHKELAGDVEEDEEEVEGSEAEDDVDYNAMGQQYVSTKPFDTSVSYLWGRSFAARSY